MNLSFFSKILIILLVLSSIFGVFLYFHNDKYIIPSSQCDIDGMRVCRLINDQKILSVQFTQPIELEEELNLLIKVPESVVLHQTWVQGINMYMGKSAVMVESTYSEAGGLAYQSKLFLGACSEPDMKWQLVVQTKDSEQNIQSYFFNFETHY
ncbi:hypothetical protein [Paraglaciecola sp. L3A3]|uniref:hypothetical protein n=1 Tax=Paraglaciecola sp. L3A3 TaxID=2686358 RepID=UPI00131E7DFA|nr:hypothetical protein [Paraglaciecola sp. L3A3]